LLPILVLLGFISLSVQPVLLALVQDHLPNYRSIANGAYMGMAFIVQSLAALLIGILGDRLGLRSTFFWMALLSFVAVLGVFLLPDKPVKVGSANS
jgi:FSR family fosmidomycin resistance protein-like MFS transporter